MNPKILVVALVAALGWGCASTDKSRLAYQVVPVSTVSHGTSGAPSYYQLARYYHGQKRYDLAEAAYRKSLAMDDGQVAAWNGLGSLHAERGDLAAAVQQFEKALTIVPDAGYLYNNLGFAYYLQGRLDESYDAIRKALAHDPTLERGWANLARIADAQSDTRLAVVVKSRQVEALPATLLADPTHIATSSTLVLPPADTAESASDNGKFVLVSASRELVDLVAPPRVARPEAIATAQLEPMALAKAETAATAKRETDLDLSRARIEVANANGISGFAKRFSALLRQERIPVRRITNHSSFLFKASVVEYQPGWEDAAKALMQRMHFDARLIPAPAARANSDVRIVLGRDALLGGRELIAKAP